MQPNEPGAREFGGTAGKGSVEVTLVVIVAVGGVVMHAPYVDDYCARGEEGRVAGAEEAGMAVFG